MLLRSLELVCVGHKPYRGLDMDEAMAGGGEITTTRIWAGQTVRGLEHRNAA
jgi:hypothetical protein